MGTKKQASREIPYKSAKERRAERQGVAAPPSKKSRKASSDANAGLDELLAQEDEQSAKATARDSKQPELMFIAQDRGKSVLYALMKPRDVKDNEYAREGNHAMASLGVFLPSMFDGHDDQGRVKYKPLGYAEFDQNNIYRLRVEDAEYLRQVPANKKVDRDDPEALKTFVILTPAEFQKRMEKYRATAKERKDIGDGKTWKNKLPELLYNFFDGPGGRYAGPYRLFHPSKAA
jgi:hypothetical protein